jgi:hypothetical protein
MGQIKDLSGGHPVAEVYLIMLAIVHTFHIEEPLQSTLAML